MKRKLTVIQALLALLAIGQCFCCLAPGLLEAPLTFLVGWVLFLIRVIPQITVNLWAIGTAVVCLAGLAVGMQRFFGWWWAAQMAPQAATELLPTPWRWRWTLALLALVVLVFAAGIAVVGISHQTAWLLTSPEPLFEGGIRVAAARSKSQNNLKEIGLAVHNRADKANGQLPGSVVDSHGTLLHGWQTQLLPYLEEDALYNQINQRLPWNHPGQGTVFQTPLKVYLRPDAPTDPIGGFAVSHYAGNINLLGGEQPMTLKELRVGRGISNVILAGEAAAQFRPWGDPTNLRDPRLGLNKDPRGFGSNYYGYKGAQFVMADGSVRSFSDEADPEFIEALANPRDWKGKP
jgi:hypothetical protein